MMLLNYMDTTQVILTSNYLATKWYKADGKAAETSESVARCTSKSRSSAVAQWTGEKTFFQHVSTKQQKQKAVPIHMQCVQVFESKSPTNIVFESAECVQCSWHMFERVLAVLSDVQVVLLLRNDSRKYGHANWSALAR